jgi:hypothetical protein
MNSLASFCHKALIALYENGTPFEARTVDFADPGSRAELFERCPVGQIPAARRRGGAAGGAGDQQHHRVPRPAPSVPARGSAVLPDVPLPAGDAGALFVG